jgi:hypothetical protein
MPNLRDALQHKSRRQFATDAALSDMFSRYAQHAGLNGAQAIQALTTQLVSIVQASAPPTEWADAANTIADEIKRRLTVVQN